MSFDRPPLEPDLNRRRSSGLQAYHFIDGVVIELGKKRATGQLYNMGILFVCFPLCDVQSFQKNRKNMLVSNLHETSSKRIWTSVQDSPFEANRAQMDQLIGLYTHFQRQAAGIERDNVRSLLGVAANAGKQNVVRFRRRYHFLC